MDDTDSSVSREFDRRKATLALNLKVARKSLGLTQEDLVKKGKIKSRATINKLEIGDLDPRLSTLVDVAHSLEVSPLLLLMSQEELEALSAMEKPKESLTQEMFDEDSLQGLYDLKFLGLHLSKIGKSVREQEETNKAEKVGIAIGLAHGINKAQIFGRSLGQALKNG